ncbi:MAG: serine hydrolase domain-containing protein, partial [Methylocella sp.]
MAAAILVAGAVAAGPFAYRIALVGSGYSAEMLCGAVFVSGRDEAAVRAEDLTGPGYELLRFFRQKVEHDNRRVTASFNGFATQTAVFRDGLGCTLIDGKTETDLRAEATGLSSAPPPSDPEALWPEGERVDTPAQNVDMAALNA